MKRPEWDDFNDPDTATMLTDYILALDEYVDWLEARVVRLDDKENDSVPSNHDDRRLVRVDRQPK